MKEEVVCGGFKTNSSSRGVCEGWVENVGRVKKIILALRSALFNATMKLWKQWPFYINTYAYIWGVKMLKISVENISEKMLKIL